MPRKRFGQNFLQDQNVLDQIIAAIASDEQDHLVEIGPGRGALTDRLAPRCGRLDLIELDRDLVALLRPRWAPSAHVAVHQADALRFDFRSLMVDGRPLRVVGNLPYNISTPLLFHLFEQADAIRDMHFMLQKEVVERLCASPGSTDYGRLSVMAAYHGRAEKLFEVPPESFFPQPRVMSAVVRLFPHPVKPGGAAADDLKRVVAAAFSQRRKTLRNALRGVVEPDDLIRLGIDPGARAENLALDDFLAIAACHGEASARS
ncbi:MAG: 16S rRNA (adenine(1518)-N(6)/adenine(1519)-N(6))-dimethyltransferase RsmA [Methylotetracoccus sp.]